MHILIAYSYTPFQPCDPIATRLIRVLSNRFDDELIEAIELPIVTDGLGWVTQVAAIRTHQVVDVYRGKINRLIALDYPAYVLPHPDKLVWIQNVYPSDIEAQQRYLREAKVVFSGSHVVAETLHRWGIKSNLLIAPMDQDPTEPSTLTWEHIIRRLTR